MNNIENQLHIKLDSELSSVFYPEIREKLDSELYIRLDRELNPRIGLELQVAINQMIING